ncbi:hypothetical protein [Natrinema sp. SYSU A 869]|uniref:hypothetical protein n=1 Tax=Natrinema sp. SYSU A 869 TaxID=2871694 RepID=UPI001CA38E67|nr:hypothetical protein [Natrinema sp. SYSU A 869]
MSIFAPPALGTGIGDATTEAADSIVVDDFPTIGTTVEVVVRLEEASVPASADETATERQLETHADST